VALLLALQPPSQNWACHISSLGSGKSILRISDIAVSVVAGRSSAPKNLLKVSHSMVSAWDGSHIPLALDRRFGTMFWRSASERRQTDRFGPRCRFAAVEAPKLSDRAGPTRDRLEHYNM